MSVGFGNYFCHGPMENVLLFALVKFHLKYPISSVFIEHPFACRPPCDPHYFVSKVIFNRELTKFNEKLIKRMLTLYDQSTISFQ